MKTVFYIVALLSFLVACHCHKEIQFKATGVQIWYVNRNYQTGLQYTVNPHNETYNNLHVIWDLTQDLPVDITVYAKVFVTDASGKEGQLIQEIEIPVCEESANRQFLPNMLIVDEDLLGKQCAIKGHYEVEDSGQLRIEYIIPNIEKKGKYFRTDYTLGTPSLKLIEVSVYAKWGYLSDDSIVEDDF